MITLVIGVLWWKHPSTTVLCLQQHMLHKCENTTSCPFFLFPNRSFSVIRPRGGSYHCLEMCQAFLIEKELTYHFSTVSTFLFFTDPVIFTFHPNISDPSIWWLLETLLAGLVKCCTFEPKTKVFGGECELCSFRQPGLPLSYWLGLYRTGDFYYSAEYE